jgi:D-alanyl-D-alanine dipeptidase
MPLPTSHTASATASSAAAIPAVSAAAKEQGFVDVRTIVPDAIIDLRYATKNNFTGERLYPNDARCLVHESMAPGLRTAAAQLREHGYVLVFWDCYRPHSVQVKMWDVVPNPMWVAEPGDYSRSHESGRSVDVTLANAANGHYVDMGTDFDDFTAEAGAYATDGLTAAQIAHREVLRNAMQSDGSLAIYSGEWWHFDGPGAAKKRAIIDIPVN